MSHVKVLGCHVPGPANLRGTNRNFPASHQVQQLGRAAACGVGALHVQVDRLQHTVVIVVGNVDAVPELPVVDGVPRGDNQGSEVPRPPGSELRATAEHGWLVWKSDSEIKTRNQILKQTARGT